jgi:RpiB/LacA/LacB family sugar-phosphate isomerase
METKVNIYIGADHRGFFHKKKIIKILQNLSYSVNDMGTETSKESSDYPVIAYKVATRVAEDKGSRGILVCMTGIGQSIAANKVKGAYAALCYNVAAARFSRLHNNANILVLSAKFVPAKMLPKIIKMWLTTDFEGGRHERRFHQIQDIEQGRLLK